MLAAVIVLVLVLAVSAAPASAQSPVLPTGCHVRLTQSDQVNIYSARNRNATPVEVPLGPNNIILQAPNFRAGQPTIFPPGANEGIFPTYFNPARTPTVEWYLQGDIAGNGPPCGAGGAPVSTVPPAIDGAPVSGGTIELHPGTWTGGGIVRRLSRLEACTPAGCLPVRADDRLPGMDGAPPYTYTVPAGLGGRRLRLTVIAYSTRGYATAASALSAPVDAGGDTPTPTSERIPSGRDYPIFVAGDLAVVPTSQQTWNGAPGPDVVHQWQRCTPGCADIAGATGLTHRISDDDVGGSIRVITTATNPTGAASWTSQELAIGSVPSPDSVPMPIVAPRLVATAAGVGRPLEVEPGVWPGDDAPDVQWQRCDGAGCTDIAGATGAEYTPIPAYAGLRLRALVTARNDAVDTSMFAPAVVVAATEPASPVTVGPASSALPQISGPGDVGAPLQLDSTGAWTPAPDSTSVTWERCFAVCEPIPGATDESYVPTLADAGAGVRALVAAATADGITRAASSMIGPIGIVRAASPPSIAGEAVEGRDLVATLGDWIGAPAPLVSAQWLLCDAAGGACAERVGATGTAVALTAADAGRTLRVRVRAVNAFSSAESVSAPTAVVRAGGEDQRPGQEPPPSDAPSPLQPAAPGALPADLTRPQLRDVRLRSRRFRIARRATALAAARRRGTALRFTVSEPGWLRIDVGRARGRRAPLGTLTRIVKAGRGSIAFTGRLGTTRLKRGRYTMTIVATDAAGNRSRAKKIGFAIVAG